MKADHFPIVRAHNGWLVSWPGFRNIHRAENKMKLVDLVFDSIGVEEAQFGVRLAGGDTEFLHIYFNDWAADRSGRLSSMIQEMYEVTGVLFDNEQSAQWLQDYFEKKLMWKKLSQPA
jgi:hypothetical protein